MSELTMPNRIVNIGTTMALAVSALSGCSSSSEAAKTALPSCSAPQPNTWVALPRNMNAPHIAESLSVDASALARYGKFGSAVCQQELADDDIGSNKPPIVSVTGIGSPCLVIGTKNQPSAGGHTKEVLAVCQTNGNAA